jgi:hypothetical protein
MRFPPVIRTIWLSSVGKVAVICVAIVLVQQIVLMILGTFLLSQVFGLWLSVNDVLLKPFTDLVDGFLKLSYLLENRVEFFILKKLGIVLWHLAFSIYKFGFLLVYLLPILQERLLFAFLLFTAHLKLPPDFKQITTLS